MTQAVPIFVLGLQRSGTTWVANMLAGSGAVAAVQAEDHRGVHESIFFSHFARAFGPFGDPEARQRFADAFEQSDYFVLSDLPSADLRQAVGRASGYADVFRSVMDAMSARDGHGFWVEKTPDHTMLGAELARWFPDARFVCVVRDTRDLIASRLAAYDRTPARGLKRKVDILRGAVVNQLYVRHLARFCLGSDRALLVRYGRLVAEPDRERARIVAFLGLGVPQEALVSAYRANTSHDRGASTRALSRADLVSLQLGEMVGRLVPLAFLRAAQAVVSRRRGVVWPNWCWKRSGFVPIAPGS